MAARISDYDHEWKASVETRLTRAERFQERTIGGLVVLSALLGGGVLGYFGHLMRFW